MNIALVIKYLYPDISEDNFVVMDNGEGQFIAEWKIETSQPTEEELTIGWEQIKDTIPTEPPVPKNEMEELKVRTKSLEDAVLLLMDMNLL